MRILYISQYFPPEVAAPAVRVSELSRLWAERGHQVQVLTGFPNHPEGVIHKEYRRAWRKGIYREDFHGVQVTRVWLVPATNSGYVGRGVNYTSFAAVAALLGPWGMKPVDVVVATSPQLLVGVAGYRMARSLKVPFVFEVRDLWPQSLVGVGASSSESLLYRCLDRTARFLYRRATHIVATTHQQRRQIVEMGIASDRVSVVMNGVDDGFRPCPEKAQALRAELNCADKFVAIYAGTLGMAHGIDTILRVAKLLEHRPEIAFWLVGDGAEREAILRQIAELGLSNVRWIGRQPRTRMPEFLTAADACLVTLRREKVFETAVPSKIFEAMAMGKPVILGVEGEARAIIEQTQAGLAVTPDDAEAILGALLRLEADRVFARRLGENGILAVRNRFARSRQAEEYLAVLGRCISPSTGAADLCTMSSSG